MLSPDAMLDWKSSCELSLANAAARARGGCCGNMWLALLANMFLVCCDEVLRAWDCFVAAGARNESSLSRDKLQL